MPDLSEEAKKIEFQAKNKINLEELEPMIVFLDDQCHKAYVELTDFRELINQQA